MFISASCFHTTAPLHTNKGGLPVKSLYLLAYKGELFPYFHNNSLIYINTRSTHEAGRRKGGPMGRNRQRVLQCTQEPGNGCGTAWEKR